MRLKLGTKIDLSERFVRFVRFVGLLDLSDVRFVDFRDWKKNGRRTMDGPTDRPTDRPSYRDAWTHLKIVLYQSVCECVQIRIMIRYFKEKRILSLLKRAFEIDDPILRLQTLWELEHHSLVIYWIMGKSLVNHMKCQLSSLKRWSVRTSVRALVCSTQLAKVSITKAKLACGIQTRLRLLCWTALWIPEGKSLIGSLFLL